MDRMLPDWISGYTDYTYETEPRYLFRKWVAISTVAACLKRKCSISIGIEKFYPNFYIVLVGPPAARKGTAMKTGQALLRQLGISQAADETSRQKLVVKLRDSAEIVTVDGILEPHSSLTIWSTELTVFLGYNNIEFLTILCKWFDCEDRFQYDTYLHDLQEVSNVWVNLFGATTPTLLQTSLGHGAIGGGFTSRTIFVYEDDMDRIVNRPWLRDDLKEPILHDLERISTLHGAFKPDTQFFDAYCEWRINQRINPPFSVPSLDAYTDRRHVFLLKLATVFSAARNDSKIVTLQDFNSASSLMAETEKNMPKVFQGIGMNKFAEVQVRIMDTITKRGVISFGELIGIFTSDVTKSQMSEIVMGLREMGFCNINPMTGEVKAKQPTCI